MEYPVRPLRFVNTPTVKELWEAEHGNEIESESTDEEVNDLSNEYDKSTGNEGFYQLMFTHVQPAFKDVNLYSGNEGLWEAIKSGVNVVIDNIKKFFKWVYSFFTSKKNLAERTNTKLTKILEVKGVKEGDIPYPKITNVIWNTTGNPGNSITWISTKMTEVDKVVKDSIKYKDALKNYISAVGKVLGEHGQLSKAKQPIADEAAKFNKKLKEIFHEGPFIGLTTLSINAENKIILKRNPSIPQKEIKVAFKTTVSIAQDQLDSIDRVNEEYGVLTTEIVKLEETLVKNLELLLRTGTNFDSNNQAEAKAVSEQVKKIMLGAMANIKVLETVIYKSINAALGVVNTAIPAGTVDTENKDK